MVSPLSENPLNYKKIFTFPLITTLSLSLIFIRFHFHHRASQFMPLCDFIIRFVRECHLNSTRLLLNSDIAIASGQMTVSRQQQFHSVTMMMRRRRLSQAFSKRTFSSLNWRRKRSGLRMSRAMKMTLCSFVMTSIPTFHYEGHDNKHKVNI